MAALGQTAALLNIGIRADTAQASAALTRLNQGLGRTANTSRQTTRQTDQLNRTTGRLRPTLASAAKAAIGLGAAYVGLQAAKQAVTATTDLAKSTLTLHKGFGLSVRTGSELGAVLKARGADATSVGMAFNTLSKQVVAAKRGTETSVKAFQEVGVSLKEIKTLSPDQLLNEISSGMESAGRGADRMAASSTLFGRGWKTVVPVLRDGTDSLKEQLAMADKYGASFGGKSLKSVHDLIMTERELKIAQLGLQVQFTEKIAPALIKVGLAIAGAIHWFEKLSPSVRKAIEIGALLAATLYGIAKAQAAVNLAMSLNPWVALVAALVIATVLIVKNWDKIKQAVGDGFKFIKKHALLIGLALAPFTLGMSLLAAVVFKNWDKIKGAFKDGIGWIKNAWGNIKDVLSAPFSIAVKNITGFINKIIGIINTVLGPVGVHIGEVGGGGSGPKKPVGVAGPTKKQRGGRIGGSGSGDTVPAMLEPGEFVLNRKAVQSIGTDKLRALNSAVPRFQQGGSVQHLLLGGAASALGGAAKGAAGLPGKAVGALGGAAGKLLGKLPGVGSLPAWLQPAGKFVLDKVGAFIKSKFVGGAAGPGGPGGTRMMDGHPVALWIADILSRARQAGVGFSVTSGYRSFAEQKAIWDSGVRPAAVPGTSHHEGTKYPSGAVDVSGAPALAAWLNSKPRWGKLLQWAGAADPVHFSHHYGGGYQRGGEIFGGGSLSKDQLTTLAKYVGMGNPALMAAIALAESGGNPTSMGGAGDKGLWQIIPSTARAFGINYGKLFDPIKNARGAAKILKGQGLSAWSTYNSGAYRSFLGGQVKPGLLARLRGQTAKTPKVQTPKVKGGKSGKTPPTGDPLTSGSQALQDIYENYLANYQADAEIQNTRIGSANELIGAGNLEALQRYQVGASQNPLLGLKSPRMPKGQPLIPLMPTDFPAAGIPASIYRTPPIPFHPNQGQGTLMGHTLPKGKGKARRAEARIHNHFYVDGKEIRGLTKVEMRRAARLANRRLPSGGG